jgi:ABC-type amino acid transport substrate-binding protein
MKRAFLALLLLLFSGCGNSGPTYKIGVNQSWYPLALEGREVNVLGFSTDLLQEIAQLKKLQLVLVYMSWDNLLSGLEEKKYDAMLSSLRPYNFNEKKYNFSKQYLLTGPVLVVPENSTIHSLDTLTGKEIAVPEASIQDSLVSTVPGVIVRTYRIVGKAISNLLDGTFDGALIDYLTAHAYCQDLYQGILRITTPPLDNEGLRLIGLQGGPPDLIQAFNEGLQELIDNGTYAKLTAKWNLPNPFAPATN